MADILHLFIITLYHLWQAIDKCKIPFGDTYFSLVDVLVVCFLFLSFGKFLSTLFGFANDVNDFNVRHEAWKIRKFRNINSSKKKLVYPSNRDNNALAKYKSNKYVQKFENDLKTMYKDDKGGKV